jgi:predicted ArsR family transcriptional regulator
MRNEDRKGYMASVVDERQGRFLLIENHCPICSAATAGQGLSHSELAIFGTVPGRALLSSGSSTFRWMHAGARTGFFQLAPGA